jgi:putative Holliday junction resolvase
MDIGSLCVHNIGGEISMPIVSLKELKINLPRGKRVMGIDHSARAWGLALSNPEMTIVTPLKTIRRTKFSVDVRALAGVCREYEVAGFVIGLPLNMDGSTGPRVDSVRHFADNLMAAREILGFDPLIAFHDERLSTFSAEQAMIDDLALSREKRAARIDAHAAACILQSAVDAVR